MEDQNIVCPFCWENGFDKIGLKRHFEAGHCEVYEKTISPEEEQATLRAARRDPRPMAGGG